MARLLPPLLALISLALGCALPAHAQKVSPEPSPLAPSPAPRASKVIVALGDSLTEGYGVSKDRAFPALLEAKLRAKGIEGYRILNSGISGSTTASAEQRMRWHLREKPALVILALGANDGLRGLSVDATRKNLERAIELAKKSGVPVLLAGMKMPPNYGKAYAESFARIYPELARKHRIPLIPFLLEGVGGEKGLNQGDGIHPNERGHEKVADTVFPHLLKALGNPR